MTRMGRVACRRSKGCGSCQAGDVGNSLQRLQRLQGLSGWVMSGSAWGELRVPRVRKGEGGEDGGGKDARSCKSPELMI